MFMPRTDLPRKKLWPQRSNLPLLSACAVLIACAAAVALRAQDKNPFSGDAKAAKLGGSQFRANCAFCHWFGARGGGRGPDLCRAHNRHGHPAAARDPTI